jgi:hypothetical protein
MGDPVGKASGRTFNRMLANVSDPCRRSTLGGYSHSLKISNQSPSEALDSGLPMSVYATMSLTIGKRNQPSRGDLPEDDDVF